MFPGLATALPGAYRYVLEQSVQHLEAPRATRRACSAPTAGIIGLGSPHLYDVAAVTGPSPITASIRSLRLLCRSSGVFQKIWLYCRVSKARMQIGDHGLAIQRVS